MTFLLGGAKASQAAQQPAISGLQIQTSAYGKCLNLAFGTIRLPPNLLWYGDFRSIAQKSQGASAGKGGVGGGGGGKGGGGSVSYIYKTSLLFGLCEGPIVSVNKVYKDKNNVTPASLGMTTSLGGYPQTPWTYLSTNHPTEALGYNGVAWAAVADYDLGNSPNISNHNFEVSALYSNSVGALPDADPSLIVTALLTNNKFGVGYPADKLGDLSTYQDYTLAAGLLLSFVLDTQQQTSQVLDAIAAATNSDFVVSEGILKLVPYGDETITGNGHTYTPPSSPEYDLTDDDFIADQGEDPIILTRKRPTDAINWIRMEYLDRAADYNTAIAEGKLQAWIDLYGLRPQPDTGQGIKLFADATAAQASVNLMLQRQLVLNTYTFKTDQRFIGLDPMDIITITDSRLGLDRQWVRIISIKETADMLLEFEVEEYLGGTGSAANYSFETGSGYNVNYNEAPPDVNPPVIYEVPVQIATNTGLETWLSVSGEGNWGGCDIYVSSDDATYQLVGRTTGPNRQGVLTADLPVGEAVDTVNTLSIDLSEMDGELTSGTQEDATLGHTLCYVDGELISFETATLTSAFNYDLTYLVRGMYGTTIAEHLTGTQFARLDDSVFVYTYDKSQIGKTIYVKFCSFNIWGGAVQSLADVTAYAHVIVGPPIPPDVTGFGAQQNGGSVVFHWNQVADFALKGYDILYGPQGGTLPGATFLTEAAKGTEMTNASVPPGDWTFYIYAVDIADQISANVTTFDLTVTNENTEIFSQEYSPDFVANAPQSSGFYTHWTGILIPQDQNMASSYGYEMFDRMVPTPVALAIYVESPDIDAGIVAPVRVWNQIGSATGVGEGSDPPSINFILASSDTPFAGTYSFARFSLGYVDARYFAGGISYAPEQGNCSYINLFKITLDSQTTTDPINDFAVGSGGTTLTFADYGLAFHEPPNVQVTPSSAGASSGAAINVTNTGCEIHLYLGSTGVSGTANITITGV